MVTIRKLAYIIILLLTHQTAIPQNINFDDFSEDTDQLLGAVTKNFQPMTYSSSSAQKRLLLLQAPKSL